MLPAKSTVTRPLNNEFFLFYPASFTFYLLKRGIFLNFICPHPPTSPWGQTGSIEPLLVPLLLCSRQRTLGFAPQYVLSGLQNHSLRLCSLRWILGVLVFFLVSFPHYFVLKLNTTPSFWQWSLCFCILVLLVWWLLFWEGESDIIIYYFKARSLPPSFNWLHSIPLYGYITIYLSGIPFVDTWIIDSFFALTNITP